MDSNPVLSSLNNITLITLEQFPSKIQAISQLFDEIGNLGINIDMISMAPSHSAVTDLSFTISDEDLVDMLTYTAKLKEKHGIQIVVSSENSKISIYDEMMRNTPGIAAKVFAVLAASNADLRLITTSEIEISLLVPSSDYDTVYAALSAAFPCTNN